MLMSQAQFSIDPLNLSKTATLTFSEEFNNLHFWDGKAGLDTRLGWAMWPNYERGFTLTGNGEEQWYTQPGYTPTSLIDTFHVSDGTLSITARKTPAALLSDTDNHPYTSGLISTYHEFSQTYGYFEMRAQLPSGQGLWPAFWLLPENNSWPPELDVMEQLGSNPEQIILTAHSNAAGSHTQDGSAIKVANTSTGYHTYGVDWQHDNIIWYFDGQKVAQVATPADMNSPMYMIANLAVGGYWPGSPNSNTTFPAQMKIDYIRAYTSKTDDSNQSPTQSSPLGISPQVKPAAITIGEGPDKLVLQISQDAYRGNAQYTVSVDGHQIGGNLRAQAAHTVGSSAQDDQVTVQGSFGAGPHTVTVYFLNDDYGGSANLDLNLYVDGVSYNGTAVANSSMTFKSNGPQSVAIPATTTGMPAPSAPENENLTANTKDLTSSDIHGIQRLDAAAPTPTNSATNTTPAPVLTTVSTKAAMSAGLVDAQYYLAANPDVAASGMDPAAHYASSGWKEGRNPDAFFSTNGYLAANPDVAKAGMSPLDHYDQFGWKEGRDPSAAFDNEQYLAHNPDVKAAGMDPLLHYLQYGQVEGRATYAAIGKPSDFTHGSFDSEYYLLANPDVAKAALASGGDSFAFAFQHYQSSGWKEGRKADAFFDSAYYLAHNPDVAAAGMNPLAHYDQFGWKEGRDPSAGFDTGAYLAANPDVAAAHIDPLLHYLQFGANEGRHLA